MEGQFAQVATNQDMMTMSHPACDEEFVTRFVANQNRVYRFILTLVPQRQDAEDLFQQTCLTLWQQWAKFDPALGDFTSWACAIAHNHIRNYRRRVSARPNTLSDDVLEALIVSQTTHRSLLDDWHRALPGCLEKLTEPQKVLVQRSYGGESIKEAAAAVGRSPNAAYKLLRHIRAILHDCIRQAVEEGGSA